MPRCASSASSPVEQPQVLAAPPGGGNRAPGHRPLEVRRAGQVAADRPGVQHLRGGHRAARYMMFEAAPHGLDLGKLRHPSPGADSGPAVRGWAVLRRHGLAVLGRRSRAVPGRCAHGALRRCARGALRRRARAVLGRHSRGSGRDPSNPAAGRLRIRDRS